MDASQLPQKMSLEEYLGRQRLSSPVCNYNLDKVRLPHGETERQRKARIKGFAEAQSTYSAARKAAIEDYQKKVDAGEIIPKTALERKLDTARGHPDNPSVQAARRVLAKRGIDWRTGERLNPDPSLQDEALLIQEASMESGELERGEEIEQ